MMGYGFTGELQAGGLVHLRARDYDPVVGQFITRDSWEGGCKWNAQGLDVDNKNIVILGGKRNLLINGNWYYKILINNIINLNSY
jgi:hypothetical protein